LALSAAGQNATKGATKGGAAPGVLLIESASVGSPLDRTGELYREIDDPHTGDRWLLLRGVSHPAGPGHMVLAEKSERARDGSGVSGGKEISNPGPDVSLPVIHRGDSLIVERETATVDERLEAVALGPAARGSLFDLRLKIGGRVYRAVATGSGRAAFAAEQGAQ